MTLSDWNALSEEERQDKMREAYTSGARIQLGRAKYSVDLTFDNRYALLSQNFFSIIYGWFR